MADRKLLPCTCGKTPPLTEHVKGTLLRYSYQCCESDPFNWHLEEDARLNWNRLPVIVNGAVDRIAELKKQTELLARTIVYADNDPSYLEGAALAEMIMSSDDEEEL